MMLKSPAPWSRGRVSTRRAAIACTREALEGISGVWREVFLERIDHAAIEEHDGMPRLSPALSYACVLACERMLGEFAGYLTKKRE